MTPPGRAPVIFLTLLIIGFWVLAGWLQWNQTGKPVNAAGGAHWPMVVWAAIITVALIVPMSWAIRRRSLVLTDSSLIFRGGLYRRTIPLAEIIPATALEFSLMEHPEYAPRWRTNAIGLPGYRVGWFRLRNGQRALLYLTDPSHVTYLPTTDGFALLLSTRGLLDALRRRGVPITQS